MPDKRALVAEDSPSMARYLQIVLKGLSYSKIDIVGDGEQALAMIDAHRYDLVLLDHCMPKMTGLEVLRRLKHGVPRLEAPVILVSHAIDQALIDAIRNERLGVSAAIRKPFTTQELKEKIETVRKPVEFIGGDTASFVIGKSEDKIDLVCRKFSIIISKKEHYHSITFYGNATNDYSAEIKDAFDRAVKTGFVNIIMDLSGLDSFDEYFIGILVSFLGVVQNGRRTAALILGKGEIGNRFQALGVTRLVPCHQTTADYYVAIAEPTTLERNASSTLSMKITVDNHHHSITI